MRRGNKEKKLIKKGEKKENTVAGKRCQHGSGKAKNAERRMKSCQEGC